MDVNSLRLPQLVNFSIFIFSFQTAVSADIYRWDSRTHLREHKNNFGQKPGTDHSDNTPVLPAVLKDLPFGPDHSGRIYGGKGNRKTEKLTSFHHDYEKNTNHIKNPSLGNHRGFAWRKEVASTSLHRRRDLDNTLEISQENSKYNPGQKAQPFQLETLKGSLLFPSDKLSNRSLLFHLYDANSAFVQAMWGDQNGSLNAIIENATENSHYIFIPVSLASGEEIPAKFIARHLSALFFNASQSLLRNTRLSRAHVEDVTSRLHFVSEYYHNLGNWIPSLLMEWSCVDHNCGYDQVAVTVDQSGNEYVSPRIDARYDWLPSPKSKFKDNTLQARYHGDGCKTDFAMKGHIAIVQDGNCSYFKKVSQMQASGAVGVIVVTNTQDAVVKDMTCVGDECNTPLNIPASMIPYYAFNNYPKANFSVHYQNTPSPSFFFAIDPKGQLSEVGWFLYPSFMFLVWQDQWFKFRQELDAKLSSPATVLTVFNNSVMHGSKGAVNSVKLPSDINKYSKVELDMALSCPGTRDSECAAWDHTVQLYVCCYTTSPLCGMELGRWITPFRRRIGRWLTDVTSLSPLIEGTTCTFTMKTAAWASPWLTSLNLRLSKGSASEYPITIQPLFYPGFTFNAGYNDHWKPVLFTYPKDVKNVSMVKLVAVITGHGSDNNECGEFCITTHVFTVNNAYNCSRTFSNAGTPLGCAEQVPFGVVPNEHGTWLYGRDGWCDGQQVSPLVYDITSHVTSTATNNITYRGLFQGQTPHPTENPGEMIVYSYLVFYTKR